MYLEFDGISNIKISIIIWFMELMKPPQDPRPGNIMYALIIPTADSRHVDSVQVNNFQIEPLCFWLNKIRITKKKRLRWARYVARKEKKRNAKRVLVGK